MKKLILFIIIATAFIACNDDFLDVEPRSELSDATFWRNASDAVSASVGVYDAWSGKYNADLEIVSRARYLGDPWSDDAQTSGFWNGYYYNQWGLGNISPEDEKINLFWKGLYKSIRRTNVFLDNIHLPDMDETLRAQLTGEVKFIRAFQYHILLNNFGGVPIVDKALSVDELEISRASASETVDFIIADLEDAISALPTTTSESGRITKGAAMGLKARVLLYAERWNEAAVAAKALIDLDIHNLFQTPAGDGYQKQFVTEGNTEVLASWKYDSEKRANEKPALLTWWQWWAGGNLSSPTQALVDAYDGYDSTTDAIIAIDPANPFTNRDPRITYTIVAAGSSTGYGCSKYLGGNESTENILIRYAEVLLTYAEAKIEDGSIDPSVLDAINQVRARAYGAAINDIGSYPEVTTTVQVELRDIVRNERRVELAMEGLRWFDVRRWKIGHGATGTMPQLAEKDYLRPIPQEQIDISGSELLSQNPGY